MENIVISLCSLGELCCFATGYKVAICSHRKCNLHALALLYIAIIVFIIVFSKSIIISNICRSPAREDSGFRRRGRDREIISSHIFYRKVTYKCILCAAKYLLIGLIVNCDAYFEHLAESYWNIQKKQFCMYKHPIIST